MLSRLISLFPPRLISTPPTLTRTTVRCPLTRERRGYVVVGDYVGGWVCMRGVRRGLGGTLSVGGYVGGVRFRIRWGGRWGVFGYVGGGGIRRGDGVGRGGQKCCFWALFGKLLHIGRAWMNVFVRVLQKVAEIRVIIYKI